MNKSELAELLNRINEEYFGKISQFMKSESFFNTWHEALKEYDYDLIKYVYGQYNDTQFPPTAKYFTVFSDQNLDMLKEELRLATNEIWVYSIDGWQATNEVLTEYIASKPWKDKLQELSRVKCKFIIATHKGNISIKEWINERGE